MAEPGLRLIQLLFRASRRLPGIGLGAAADALARSYFRGRTGPVVTDVLGSRMLLDPTDVVDRILLLYPWRWDPDEMAFLREHLRPGMTFVDVGAHVGYYALTAARCVAASGTVLAIEADPRTFETLSENVRLNALTAVIRPVQMGVTDSAGTILLSRPPVANKGGSSLLYHAEGWQQVEVPCAPLLQILDHAAIHRANGMKLDIEGFEYRVMRAYLRGCEPARWPEFVITEQVEGMTELAGGNVVDLLVEHGYRLAARHANNAILVRTSER